MKGNCGWCKAENVEVKDIFSHEFDQHDSDPAFWLCQPCIDIIEKDCQERESTQ